MVTPRERVIEWLRDAHAAEEQAHTMLRKTAQQIEGQSEFRAGLERHGQLSQTQASRLKDCLEDLGESTSVVKTIIGQITAVAQTISGYVVSDEPVKAVLAVSSFAQMEVSSYRILVTAAEVAGMTDVASMCQTLLNEELRFAQWAADQTEPVTRQYLTLQGAKA